ncbi:MAG: MptD family putative ECF transporter S component [Clostridiales bacterium]|jgi:putative ECF transporter S component (TIGR02185 family)|nr:MptD family putative ECF transporter S component [Clostridiales bacterium]
MQETTTSSRKLTVKDIITLTVLTVLMIVIAFGLNTATMFNHILNLVFAMGLICFLIAPLYVLMAHRVNKTGTIAFFMVAYALANTVMGYWYVGLFIAVCAVVCEVIMFKPNSYKTPWKNCIAFGIFSFTMLSTSFLPLWLFWDKFYATSTASGMSAEYLNTFKNFYTNGGILTGIAAFTVCAAVLGVIVGYVILNKYFKKAGYAD